MTAFDFGVDLLFLDQNLALDALWRAAGAGAGVAVRVMRRAPLEVIEWRDNRVRVGTVLIDVRVSEVVTLSKGDTFEIGAVIYTVTGAPELDTERLVWRAEAREK